MQPVSIELSLSLCPLTHMLSHFCTFSLFSQGSQQLRFQAELDFNGDEIARRYIRHNNLDLEKLCKELDTKEKLETFLIRYGARRACS